MARLAERGRAFLIVVVLLSCAHARAEDPDTEAAKRHFAAGLELYGLDRYADAVREFEAARTLKPIPAFDFNIGRCQERLERWADAVTAYERFLAEVPAFAPETIEIRERLGVLKARVGKPRARPHASSAKAIRVLGPVALGIGAAALVAGTGAYLSVYPDYADEKARCAGSCDPGSVAALWTRVERAQTAGVALWSIGGALAAIGIPLVVLSSGETSRARYAFSPIATPGTVGLSVGGTLP